MSDTATTRDTAITSFADNTTKAIKAATGRAVLVSVPWRRRDGSWAAGATYAADDVVQFGAHGVAWATVANTGDNPATSTSGAWLILHDDVAPASASPTPSPTPTATVPAPPASLATTSGNGQVSLAWAASPGATYYVVQRSTASGGPYTAVSGNVASTAYSDPGLTNGTTYYYAVVAANGAGVSGPSPQASAKPVGDRSDQSFTNLLALPPDTVNSGVTVSASGNDPYLSTTGNGQWWYFNDPSNWSVAAGRNWTFSVDVLLVGNREIANVAFWVASPGASATGFFLRLDTASGSSGFYSFSGPSHNSGLGTLASAGAPTGDFLRLTLSYGGGSVVSATAIDLVTGSTYLSTSFDFTSTIASLGSGYANSGTFGQAPDHAGGPGQFWRNATLTGGV